MKVLTLFGMIAALAAALALPGCGRSLANDPAANAEKSQEIRLALNSGASSGAAAAETQAAAKATGWGTIKGRFVYDGKPPQQSAISVNKDVDFCGKHPLLDEKLVVASDGGLANVVVFARDKNIEVHPDYAATAKDDVVLDNHDCHFVPHIAVARTGQTLLVKNSDSVSHNTNAAFNSNGAFNNIIPSGSKPLEAKLTQSETAPAPVACTIHPWMKGFVVVQNHPYVAVTGKDGTFELKNVPAGIPLQFKVWHEASTGKGNAVQASRPDLKWDPSGVFTVTLQPDQILDLADIKVPGSSLSAQ